MSGERAQQGGIDGAKGAQKANGILGSLKDALLAAGREETAPPRVAQKAQPPAQPPTQPPAMDMKKLEIIALAPPSSPSASEAARLARSAAAAEAEGSSDTPPTTRVIRAERAKPAVQAASETEIEAVRTELVRGRRPIARGTFERDPVVGFLVVVGGPGLGSYRPVFEGNNALGRSTRNRIPLDFGDEAISAEEQAYIRYDSADRTFLFVPNLAKTNVVSVNEKRPTGAVQLSAMDVITLGRTQVAFLPFCGAEFDWSEIAES